MNARLEWVDQRGKLQELTIEKQVENLHKAHPVHAEHHAERDKTMKTVFESVYKNDDTLVEAKQLKKNKNLVCLVK